jgi:penicillin V acylase-like amidase (Ntn superfamily)
MFRCLSLFLGLLFYTSGNTCTTFLLNHNGQLVFGRNYDWVSGNGMVCTNNRGLIKTSMKNPDGTSISWTSKYGSITFNQFGKEFPTGGMNEQGLVVELMWLDGTVYPPAADKRPSIGVLQWIQYQLDNCTTIEEVIATDAKLRITSSGTPLHYLIADAKGHAATIEFLDGKIVVHKGDQLPVPVLTNNTYDQSVTSKNRGTYSGNNSLERFVTTCNMIQQYKTNPGTQSLTDHAFDILNKVSQPNFTRWSIVYDISNKKIWFKTDQVPHARYLIFAAFDFTCKQASKTIDMNAVLKGDISTRLTDFTPGFNTRTIEKTLVQSRSRITIPDPQKRALLAYNSTIHCE